MSWESLAANQMVSFTDAQGGGFALNSGQSHTTSNQLMTKNQAYTKYLLQGSALSSYAENQLVPKSAWVAGATPFSWQFKGSSQGLGFSATCADHTGATWGLYTSSQPIIVGSILYTEPSLVNKFDGGGLGYWDQATNKVVTINSVGSVTAITDCNVYGGTIRLNIPGVGNDIASNSPGNNVLSGYTLNSTITIKNIHATQSLLFKDASLSSPYPVLVTSGAARLMRHTSTFTVHFNTAPTNDEIIGPNSSAGWLSFGKDSGSGIAVLSLEYQNSSGARTQEYWTFNI